MNEKLRRDAHRAVSGLLALDKMQLIYWILKAHLRDRWLLHNFIHLPTAIKTAADDLSELLEDADVDLDSASHHFLRFYDPTRQWWVCSSCGTFTTTEETKPGPHHEPGCTGLCDYKITGCDFYTDTP